MKQFIKETGFAVFEMIVVVVIIILLFGIGTIVDEKFIRVQTVGDFVNPTKILTAGVTYTFIYNVKQREGSTAPFKIIKGRMINFKVTPSHIVIVPVPGAASNALGNITVTLTPHIDYRGGGNIWATDVASGKADPPVSFTVVD